VGSSETLLKLQGLASQGEWKRHSVSIVKTVQLRNNTGRQKNSPPWENSRVIFIDLTFLNPNMATKMLHHLPVLRENGINYKTTFLVKKINIFSKLLCTVQNVKIVSMYNTLAKNN
jgi:hypothetical protein